MSNTFTLDNIREAVEKKYAPLKIVLDDGLEVELRSLLRLDKDERKIVTDALTVLEELEDAEESEDSVELAIEAMGTVIRTVAKGNARELISALGDDIPMYMQVLETWQEGTQVGEASTSPA